MTSDATDSPPRHPSRLQSWLALGLTSIGLVLVAFMVVTEDEPGALPCCSCCWVSGGSRSHGGARGAMRAAARRPHQARSKRSASITCVQARTKSRTNFGCASLPA